MNKKIRGIILAITAASALSMAPVMASAGDKMMHEEGDMGKGHMMHKMGHNMIRCVGPMSCRGFRNCFNPCNPRHCERPHVVTTRSQCDRWWHHHKGQMMMNRGHNKMERGHMMMNKGGEMMQKPSKSEMQQ